MFYEVLINKELFFPWVKWVFIFCTTLKLEICINTMNIIFRKMTQIWSTIVSIIYLQPRLTIDYAITVNKYFPFFFSPYKVRPRISAPYVARSTPEKSI